MLGMSRAAFGFVTAACAAPQPSFAHRPGLLRHTAGAAGAPSRG